VRRSSFGSESPRLQTYPLRHLDRQPLTGSFLSARTNHEQHKGRSLTSSHIETPFCPDFLGETPLLASEDRAKFKLLFDSAGAIIAPRDIFEQLWVIDFTHQSFDIFRFRRISVQLLISSQQMALERVLRHLIHGIDVGRPDTELDAGETIRNMALCKSERFAREYVRGNKAVVDEVNQVMREAGLTWDVIEAEAAGMRSNELQRITNLLAKAESRRNATLKAIERHRAGLGAQLCQAAEEFAASELDKLRAVGSAQRLAA
jgi:hypothetical protein